MAAGTHDLVCEQGADFDLVLTWKAYGLPVNLTNYSARMQVRPSKDSSTVLLSLTSAPAGGITLGGTAGTITIHVAASVTAALTEGGVYDLELVAPGGAVYRKLQGTFTLSPEVTR